LQFETYYLTMKLYKKTNGQKCFQAAVIFQLAIETGLRMSEILALRKNEVFLNERYLKVSGTQANANKTRSTIRSVPLTPMAQSLLLESLTFEWDSDFIFSIKQNQLESIFRNACRKLEIKDLHFHDSRHEATARLAQIYEVLDLAKIIGHKDLHMLLAYYQPTIDELVAKMNPVFS